MRPWLIRIAHNLASNYYRDRSRRPEANIEAWSRRPTRTSTERVVEGREELRAGDAQARRPARGPARGARSCGSPSACRNREIARALGRTDGATKVLIHRAIKQLEEQMAARTRVEAAAMTERQGIWTSRRSWRTRCGRSSPPESLRRTGRDDALTRSPSRPPPSSASWADELSEGELEALRDPRNWVRPVAAVAVGGAAAGALVAGRAPAAGASPAAAARQAPSGAARPAPLGGPERLRCASAGSARPGPASPRPRRAGQPEDQVQEVVLGVHGDEIEDDADPVLGVEEAPDRDHQVDAGRTRGHSVRAA